MLSPRWRRPALASLVLSLTLAACGGGMEAGGAPASPAPIPGAEEQPARATVSSSVEGAAEELDRAEAELFQLIGGEGGRPDAAGAPLPKKGETELGGDRCDIACRALSSMQRAAEHLCGLSGEDDERCAGARTRVRSATDRVRDACPACAGP